MSRKSNPIIREEVTTITTPGELIDVIVTESGFAVNIDSVRPEVRQRNEDILDKLVSSGMKCHTIEELRKISLVDSSEIHADTGDQLIGLVKYIDGTVLDSIYSVKGDQ